MRNKAALSRLPFEVVDVLSELGNRVATVRRVRELTQADLAAKAGVSIGTMVDIEQGASTVQMGRWLSVLWALDLTPGLASVLSSLGKDDDGVSLMEAQLPKRVRGPRRS
ncbi:hypothetical protein BH09PSE5_BH09PSE5_05140 [soil metagenome]